MLMSNEKIYTSHWEGQTFESMHLKLKKPIEQYVFFLTGIRQDSEDVAQEVFIKLWINWAKLQTMNEDELKDYIFITIRNHLINEKKYKSRPKRNKKQFLIEYVSTNPGYYLHDEILISEGFKQHQQAIDRLPKKERLVYLYHADDYHAGEIAKKLNRSECTIQNQLSAAYKRVKTYLNKNYDWNLRESGRRNYWKHASLN